MKPKKLRYPENPEIQKTLKTLKTLKPQKPPENPRKPQKAQKAQLRSAMCNKVSKRKPSYGVYSEYSLREPEDRFISSCLGATCNKKSKEVKIHSKVLSHSL